MVPPPSPQSRSAGRPKARTFHLRPGLLRSAPAGGRTRHPHMVPDGADRQRRKRDLTKQLVSRSMGCRLRGMSRRLGQREHTSACPEQRSTTASPTLRTRLFTRPPGPWQNLQGIGHERAEAVTWRHRIKRRPVPSMPRCLDASMPRWARRVISSHASTSSNGARGTVSSRSSAGPVARTRCGRRRQRSRRTPKELTSRPTTLAAPGRLRPHPTASSMSR